MSQSRTKPDSFRAFGTIPAGTVAAAVAALGVFLLGIGGGSVARADILPGATTPTVTATGTGTYLYSYEVFVTNTQDINTGNFFRFYDFNGLVAVRAAPAGWTSTVTATDPPFQIDGIGTVTPNDSASVPNVTFTYGGPTILGGPTSLGVFQLESTLPAGMVRPFAGNGTDKVTTLPNGNLTNYTAPIAAVPEPGEYAAMGIFGAGLVGLMLRARGKWSRLDRTDGAYIPKVSGGGTVATA